MGYRQVDRLGGSKRRCLGRSGWLRRTMAETARKMHCIWGPRSKLSLIRRPTVGSRDALTQAPVSLIGTTDWRARVRGGLQMERQ